MTANVAVYIAALTPDTASQRIQYLMSLFPGTNYVVRAPYIPPPPNLTPSSTMTPTDQLQAYRFDAILTQAQTEFPGLYTLFLWESSYTVADEHTIDTGVQFAIAQNQQTVIPEVWQILYLTHWYTDCSFMDVETTLPIPGTPQRISESVNTLGFQSYLITPIGREMILGLTVLLDGELFPPIIFPVDTQILAAVQRAGMVIYVYYPSLFQYDTSFNLADYDQNVYKTVACIPTPTNNNTSPKSFKPILIAIGIFILILLLAWALYKIGPYDKCYCRPDPCRK